MGARFILVAIRLYSTYFVGARFKQHRLRVDATLLWSLCVILDAYG